MNIWTSQFGDDYTQRNRMLSVDARAIVWQTVLPLNCRSILEVGANNGANLRAIATFSDAELFACEPNEIARRELSGLISPNNLTPDFAHKLSFADDVAELAFTCGVLIHIPTHDLLPSMKEIHRCAKRWIVCAEYFAPQEEMIPYRGHDNALWRRDYGSIWLDHFPDLTHVGILFAWKRSTSLDNLTFWLFEKGAARKH